MDNEEIDNLAHQLIDELADLNMVSAELIQEGDLPEGAKGKAFTLGTILIKLVEAGGIAGLCFVLYRQLAPLGKSEQLLHGRFPPSSLLLRQI